MTEIECKTVKIGGSIGIILPKEIVRKEDIKANQSIKLEIKTHPKAREFFGILPDLKTPTQQLKDEARKGWD